MITVNKNSPLYMEASFKNEQGANTVPTTAQWRVYNPETEEVVVDWQDIPAMASSVDFVVPGEHHTIVDDHKTREVRELQFRIDVGLATEAYESMDYTILNRPRSIQ